MVNIVKLRADDMIIVLNYENAQMCSYAFICPAFINIGLQPIKHQIYCERITIFIYLYLDVYFLLINIGRKPFYNTSHSYII